MDCGHTFPPECMDWDHVRGKKRYMVSSSPLPSRATYLSEIAKCDLVCSNCHRIRTQRRRNEKVLVLVAQPTDPRQVTR
jgi:hypothetical protein